MSAPTFTPGPWRVDAPCHLGSVITDDIIVATDLYHADARLIAAGPELLEALQATLMACGMARGMGQIIQPNDPAVAQARAAIAKALGQEATS